MANTRKRYSADSKAQVALDALQRELTLAQLAGKHRGHQTMISTWRKQAVDGIASLFSGKAQAAEARRDADVEKLYAKIGQLVVERDFLAKAFGRSAGPQARTDRAGSSAALDRGKMQACGD